MKNYFKYILIFILIFFSGIITERFDYDKKILNIFNNSIDSISRTIYSFFPKEKINITIDSEEYNKLLKSRDSALKEGILKEEMQNWVPAKLQNQKLSRNIEIRLKGVFPDHWSDEKRWSFKIKIKNDSNPFNEIRRFILQAPETSSFMYEWLLMKALEKEKLISLGVKYYDLIINGSNLGTYMFQGGISEEILKKNEKEAGPIIGFSKDLFIKEYLNSQRMKKLGAIGSMNSIEDSFWRSKIEPVQFDEDNINTSKEKDLRYSIGLLEDFRSGEKKPSQVFDINKLAKIMAIRALLGSSEFDYRDTKFYFNTKTKLLEPITKEAHVDLNLNYKDYYFSWWINSSNIKDHRPADKYFFLELLYNDSQFHQLYLEELDKISKGNYFSQIIKDNRKEFDKFLKAQKFNYPTKKVFSADQININKARIQDILNPTQGINAYFINYDKNILKLNISNLQRLPIKIYGIELDNGEKLMLNDPKTIKGKIPQKPLKNFELEIDCLFKEECKKILISKQKVLFQILGQKKVKKADISMFYFKSE